MAYNKKNTCVIEGMDEDSDAKLTIDVNWSKKHPKYIKLHIREEEVVIKLDDLFSFMTMMASVEEMKKIIPIREEVMTEFVRQHTVVAQTDLKKGEHLVVNCHVSIPEMIEKEIREEIKSKVSEEILLDKTEMV